MINSERSEFDRELRHGVASNKWFLRGLGGLSLVAGVLSILMPHIATLTAELLFGVLLCVVGVGSLLSILCKDRGPSLTASLLGGILSLATGALLLSYPLSGIVALTTLMAAYFAASGLVRIYFAWTAQGATGRGWLGFGGALSLVLAALILFGLSSSAFWILGMLLGIDLVFHGIGLIGAVEIAVNREDPGDAT